jgi:SAM-dependent methyltransferase
MFRLLFAIVRYRDVAYARRLARRAAANLRLVLGSLGSHYVRVRPYEDFGGVAPGGACERFVLGDQPAGLVRVNLAAYHLALADVAGRVVVDVGTNEGAGAALLATKARQVVALDVSPQSIAAAGARYRLPNLEFHVHDAIRPYPLPAGGADVVFSSEVIEHVADGPAFIRAAGAALGGDGILLLNTPNYDFNRFENRLNVHHVNPYNDSRLRSELEVEFERVEILGLTYDAAIDRSREVRPDPLPPEAMPYSFGDPIVVDRYLALRLRITPRWVPLGGPEPPEYLWVRASHPRRAASQEAGSAGR